MSADRNQSIMAMTRFKLNILVFLLTDRLLFHFSDTCRRQFGHEATERWQKRSEYKHFDGLQGKLLLSYVSPLIIPT